jgi:hypothetical protein
MPDTPPALTPDEQIATARTALVTPDLRDRDQKLAALEAGYKAKFGVGEIGEPFVAATDGDTAKVPTGEAARASASATTVPPLEVPPVPLEVDDIHTYDREALAELGPAVVSAGMPMDEVQMWIKVGHGQLTQYEHRSADDCYATLDKRFGEEKADAMVADALAVLDRLTKPTRAAVERWLDETGLTNHPAFIEWLAGIGTKLRGAKS